MERIIIPFDLETSGLEPHHEIIQFAAVACNSNWYGIDSIEIKIQFDISKADPAALAINGYSEEKWKAALPKREAAAKIAAFLNKHKSVKRMSKSGKPYFVAQTCGYNASRYDLPKLQEFFTECELFLPASYECLDVMHLALWWFFSNPDLKPENMKLATVCNAFEVPPFEAHDAMGDVIGTIGLVARLLENATSGVTE